MPSTARKPLPQRRDNDERNRYAYEHGKPSKPLNGRVDRRAPTCELGTSTITRPLQRVVRPPSRRRPSDKSAEKEEYAPNYRHNIKRGHGTNIEGLRHHRVLCQ